MKITRILHHSANVVGGLGRATAFYTDILGLPDEARPHIPGIDGHWFGAGDAQVHLVDADAGDGPIRPAGPHVCFGVDDLAAALDELDAAGVPYVTAMQGSVQQVWIVDPSGNTIELQQDPAAV